METIYGQLAESTRINQAIYDCFDFLSEKEHKKFVKKFKEQPHTKIQVMHTFRELLLGAYLSSNGFMVESDRSILGKTPDWSIQDSSNNPTAIVEMVYHHIDYKTNNDILSQINAGKKVIAYWPHSNDPSFHRLYTNVQEKTAKYKDLVSELNVPYVVAVFMDFETVIDVEETKECLMGGDVSLFKLYPDLSGVMQFEENCGIYEFSFIENTYALRKINIPSGNF